MLVSRGSDLWLSRAMLMYGASLLDAGNVNERATIFIVTRMSIKARNALGKSVPGSYGVPWVPFLPSRGHRLTPRIVKYVEADLFNQLLPSSRALFSVVCARDLTRPDYCASGLFPEALNYRAAVIYNYANR